MIKIVEALIRERDAQKKKERLEKRRKKLADSFHKGDQIIDRLGMHIEEDANGRTFFYFKDPELSSIILEDDYNGASSPWWINFPSKSHKHINGLDELLTELEAYLCQKR